MSESVGCVAQPPSERDVQLGHVAYATDILVEDEFADGVSAKNLQVIMDVASSRGELVLTQQDPPEEGNFVRLGAIVVDSKKPFDYYIHRVEGSQPARYRKQLFINPGKIPYEDPRLDVPAAREIAFSKDSDDTMATWMGGGIRYEQKSLMPGEGPARIAVGTRQVSELFTELSTEFTTPAVRIKVLGALFHVAYLAKEMQAPFPAVPELRAEIRVAIEEYERRLRVAEALVQIAEGFSLLEADRERSEPATNWIFDRPLEVPKREQMADAASAVHLAVRDNRHSLKYVQEGREVLYGLLTAVM